MHSYSGTNGNRRIVGYSNGYAADGSPGGFTDPLTVWLSWPPGRNEADWTPRVQLARSAGEARWKVRNCALQPVTIMCLACGRAETHHIRRRRRRIHGEVCWEARVGDRHVVWQQLQAQLLYKCHGARCPGVTPDWRRTVDTIYVERYAARATMRAAEHLYSTSEDDAARHRWERVWSDAADCYLDTCIAVGIAHRMSGGQS